MKPNEDLSEIEKFVNFFTEHKIDNVIRIRKKFFQINDELKEIIDSDDKNPFSVGIYLGEITMDGFRASLELLSWIAKHSDKKVFVNEKSSWMFLCKKDIFSEGIVKHNFHPKKNKGKVLVQNEYDENLGIGKILAPLDSPHGNMVIKNVLDRGDFLRRER